MKIFYDIFDLSLNKFGEELCGDKVKVFKGEQKTILVLSDGLGSGVKANILATLTTEIIVTMLKAAAPLQAVIETVIGTLPVCKTRQISYATFTIVEIENSTGQFKVINFDNPKPFCFKRGVLYKLGERVEQILGREIRISTGVLQQGDFLGLASDGILLAGLGGKHNFGWGWDNVARHLADVFYLNPHSPRPMVRGVITEAHTLYQGKAGDDSTFVGLLVRPRNNLIIFTGPPLNQQDDDKYAAKVVNFDGRKVVCGGTTGNIVSTYLVEPIEIDTDTLREDVPPIGHLAGIDLLTEGILTMLKALEFLKRCHGSPLNLPKDDNGAVRLAKELLQADSVHFLVGQTINEFYQNPLLPQSVSIRNNLVKEIAEFLTGLNKDVSIEYC